MAEVNLLARLPRSRRNVNARAEAKSPEVIATSRKFGQEYFDGPREYGYGGYRYDGRWVPIAEDIVAHFGLKAGDRVLDVGCAKGFLVKDLMKVCPGLEVFGIDISEYAVMHCEPEVVGRLHLGSCEHLPFPSNSFSAVVSINTIHNQNREGVIRSLKEVQRLCGGRAYVQVDSYRDEEQRQLFLDWVLTANFHDYPDGWRKVFAEAGYTGDYYWTIVE
ncbi:methyltransferase [Hypericibacter terrae]|jgi:SAM-dependent methyltransferase|uniref:Methyltransferase n=1 Tax=Hypericibacter terrae TaxID=2602015 RepID=A0A5J6MCL9_9PROT|nr:class I SAM-dependent methyltransferase [Hypericibacter terrae]QEX15064.1 methyltransferase [Hypericibacter terrae]